MNKPTYTIEQNIGSIQQVKQPSLKEIWNKIICILFESTICTHNSKLTLSTVVKYQSETIDHGLEMRNDKRLQCLWYSAYFVWVVARCKLCATSLFTSLAVFRVVCMYNLQHKRRLFGAFCLGQANKRSFGQTAWSAAVHQVSFVDYFTRFYPLPLIYATSLFSFHVRGMFLPAYPF